MTKVVKCIMQVSRENEPVLPASQVFGRVFAEASNCTDGQCCKITVSTLQCDNTGLSIGAPDERVVLKFCVRNDGTARFRPAEMEAELHLMGNDGSYAVRMPSS